MQKRLNDVWKQRCRCVAVFLEICILPYRTRRSCHVCHVVVPTETRKIISSGVRCTMSWPKDMVNQIPCKKIWNSELVKVEKKPYQETWYRISGWWLGHPSEKYEFVHWDDKRNSQYFWENQKLMATIHHQPDMLG